MRDLRVRFEGLDNTFTGLLDQTGFITGILRTRYNVIVMEDGNDEPDVLFYSWLGMKHIKWHKCIRVYITMEMDFPDFNLCDYAIGLVNIGMPHRYMHLPSYVYYNYLLEKYENRNKEIDQSAVIKRDFCSIVLSNIYFRDSIYEKLFDALNEYKLVASGGKWRNNIGVQVKDKLNFIRRYKFNIAVENTDVDGYVTEKIMEPFVAGTVPIYWGNSWVKKEFGEGGYINIQDFDTLDRAVEFIKKVDANDELYLKMLARGPQIPFSYGEWRSRLLDFLVKAIEHGKYLKNYELYHIVHKEHFWVYYVRSKVPIKLYCKIVNAGYRFWWFIKRHGRMK